MATCFFAAEPLSNQSAGEFLPLKLCLLQNRAPTDWGPQSRDRLEHLFRFVNEFIAVISFVGSLVSPTLA